MKHSFAELFKKYRLRAEFEKLSEFGNALAEKGFIYEDSIFSHWQKGSRMPNSRILLCKIVEIFIERKAIVSIEEANYFFESTGLGYLTQQEIKALPFVKLSQTVFQVPSEISTFSGRKQVITSLKKNVKKSIITLICGQAGVGKTAVAIHLGHILKDEFPDGVLWYRLDTSDITDILAAIAYSYGENIEHIKDVEIRASFVRSLLSKKKTLLIFDNAEQNHTLRMIIPNNTSCSVIITSQYKALDIPANYTVTPLSIFTKKETLELYYQILGKRYVDSHIKDLTQSGELLGHLPLAVSIFANQIKNSSLSISIIKLMNELQEEKIQLQTFTYQNTDFQASINISFRHLPKNIKNLFISLGVFDGKDFSLKAVAFINKISARTAENMLQNLTTASLIENTTKQRYQFHPLIKTFVRQKINNKEPYINAALFFEKLLKNNSLERENIEIIEKDIHNIIFIFERCYKLGLYKQVIALWKYLGNFLYSTGDWNRTMLLGKLTYKSTKITKDYSSHVHDSIRILNLVAFWQGDIHYAEILALEGLELSTSLGDEYLIAINQQLLSETYRSKLLFNESLILLQHALEYFEKTNNTKESCQTLKYIGETYMLMDKNILAEEFLKKAFIKAQSINYIMQLASISSLLGGVFFSKKDFRKSRQYFFDSLDYELLSKKRSGNRIWANIGLGLIAIEKGSQKLAEKYFSAAKSEIQYLGIKTNIDKLYIGNSYIKQKIREDEIF